MKNSSFSLDWSMRVLAWRVAKYQWSKYYSYEGWLNPQSFPPLSQPNQGWPVWKLMVLRDEPPRCSKHVLNFQMFLLSVSNLSKGFILVYFWRHLPLLMPSWSELVDQLCRSIWKLSLWQCWAVVQPKYGFSSV